MIYRQFIAGMTTGLLLTTNLMMAADELADLEKGLVGFNLADLTLCKECKVESHKHAASGKECHTAHRSKKKSDPSHDELNDHHTEGLNAENNHKEGHSSDSDESAHESD